MLTNLQPGLDPSHQLHCLSVIFKGCNVPRGKVAKHGQHPCAQAAFQLWPLLAKCLEVFAGSQRTIERCNQCIRNMIRCLDEASLELIPTLIRVLSDLFASTRHSSCLYVADMIVKVFGVRPELQATMFEMVSNLAMACFSILSQVGEGAGKRGRGMGGGGGEGICDRCRRKR